MHIVMVGGVFAAATGLTLGTSWPLVLDLAIWVFAFLFAGLNYLDDETDRTRILTLLERRDAFGFYTRAVDATFGLLTRMIAPKERDDPVPDGFWAKVEFHSDLVVPTETRFQKPGFSWPVADMSLKLAIIYPLLALLLQWAWTGSPTGVGEIVVLPAEERLWPRLATTCPLVALLLTSMTAAARRRPARERIAAWLIWLAIAGTIAIAEIATGAGKGVVAVALLFAFAVAGAAAVETAAAAASAFAIALALALGLTFEAVPAFALAVAVPVLVNRAIWFGRGLRAYALLLVCFVIAMTGLLILAPEFGVGDTTRLLIFVLCLLPALNAIFDFLSYGTTITLLHIGAPTTTPETAQRDPDHRLALFAILDVVAAFLYLIALGLTLTLVVAFINAASGVSLLDLDQVFADLRDPARRGDYTWLILACLTTLVPTLIHVVIAALSCVAWLPDALRGWVRDHIEAKGDLGTLFGTGAAALFGTLALCVMFGVFFSVAALFTEGLNGPTSIGAVGLLVLECVETLARLVGALSDPLAVIPV